jgi:hypothetical protein
MISQLLRCSGVASDNRHDHASGTLIVRPSASCAVITSSVTSIATIRGSLFATVFIPCLQDAVQIVEDYPSDSVKLPWGEADIGTEHNSLLPEFAGHAFTTYMHMLWFIAIEAVKENPVRSWYTSNSWH